MRIEELLEEQQLDELSLSGIGKGLGKAAGAVGSAVGGVQGAWAGMKNAYGQKRDRVAAVAQRNVRRAGGYRANKVSASGTTGSGNTQSTTQNTANNATTSASSNSIPQTSVPTTKTADEIAKTLSDIYSNQSNPLGVPKVKQEIISLAKHAGMTGQTIQESEKFNSKFLGMDI